jgi:ABC-type Fe3+/spermidine/putrescine transport system ATPase subunit/ABC-type nitrate/sulfonate/bicarbonate transport system permease component
MRRVSVLWIISTGLVFLALLEEGSGAASGLAGAPAVVDMSPFNHFVWLLCALSICMGALYLGVWRAALRSTSVNLPANKTSARRLLQLSDKLQYYCGVVALAQLLILVWLLFTRNIPLLPHGFLPSPVDVVDGLYAERTSFLSGACWSTIRLMGAFVIAVVIGLPLGIVCGRSKQAIYLTPYSSILAVLPPIILVPICLLVFSPATISNAFGQDFADRILPIFYDETFRIAATGFTAFWSVFSAALRASVKTPVELLQAAEGLGAGRFQRLRDIVLPLSLPSVFFGAKAGLTIGFIVLIYTEGIKASDKTLGLGGLISSYYDSGNIMLLYSMIAVLALITLILHKCLDSLEALLAPWDRKSEEPTLISILRMNRKDELNRQTEEAKQKIPLSERVRTASEYLLRHRTLFDVKTAVIQFDGIKADYNGRSVLSIDKSMTVTSGNVIALIGESGNGKTTLSRVIAGFIKPSAGTLTVNGKEVLRNGKRLYSGITPNVAYMFQDHALFPHLTVRKNLELVFRYRKQHLPTESEQIDNAIFLLRLETLVHAYPSQLSGGEKQRLALARALLMDQPVLIIDEGLSSIDQPSKSLLRNVIRDLTKKLNLTTLYISHDREDVLQIADRIWYLKDGNIIANEKPHALFYDAKTVDTARFLGHTNLFRGFMSGDTLELQSYLDRPDDVMSPCSVRVSSANAKSSGDGKVLAYIPKNSIDIESEATAEHLPFGGIVGDPAFSGSEWELRIRTGNGAEFDVVLPEDEYRRFTKCVENKEKLSVVVHDAQILAEN